jgi:signal-transduction protein with cAMP-binding, CBS, and nucleotidyltransferase domain
VKVREGMNEIVVTVGPAHTMHEAARRMAARNVGAAVVMDPERPGPGIVTERDLLRSVGRGENPNEQLVADHLTVELQYAAADWSLERAAEVMTEAAIRHVVVLDGAEVVGILSMRDIVRCWIREGAIRDLTE